MIRIENPTVIATHDFTWHKKDGTEVPIHVMIGAPYRQEIDWACPCAIFGLEGRYPDIVGISGLQALSLALRLLRKRITEMVEEGEVFDLNADGCKLGLESIATLFGIGCCSD